MPRGRHVCVIRSIFTWDSVESPWPCRDTRTEPQSMLLDQYVPGWTELKEKSCLCIILNNPWCPIEPKSVETLSFFIILYNALCQSRDQLEFNMLSDFDWNPIVFHGANGVQGDSTQSHRALTTPHMRPNGSLSGLAGTEIYIVSMILNNSAAPSKQNLLEPYRFPSSRALPSAKTATNWSSILSSISIGTLSSSMGHMVPKEIAGKATIRWKMQSHRCIYNVLEVFMMPPAPQILCKI